VPQTVEAAVRDVVFGRERVRNADAREREPLLTLQIRDLVDDAHVARVFATFQKTRVE
jgi:hypothetical protein